MSETINMQDNQESDKSSRDRFTPTSEQTARQIGRIARGLLAKEAAVSPEGAEASESRVSGRKQASYNPDKIAITGSSLKVDDKKTTLTLSSNEWGGGDFDDGASNKLVEVEVIDRDNGAYTRGEYTDRRLNGATIEQDSQLLSLQSSRDAAAKALWAQRKAIRDREKSQQPANDFIKSF